MPVISLNRSVISGLCGLFHLCKISLAATIKPVTAISDSAFVRPCGMIHLSPKRHRHGDSVKGCLSHPSRFSSSTFQKGSTRGHFHKAWRKVPTSVTFPTLIVLNQAHFKQFQQWKIEFMYNFLMYELASCISCSPPYICNHIFP